jgi:hypothetical protein
MEWHDIFAYAFFPSIGVFTWYVGRFDPARKRGKQ